MVSDDFIKSLIGEQETSPPMTTEQQLQDSINVLAHKMEENLNSIRNEINNINERMVNNHEEITSSESKEGNGQTKSLQNDTIPNNDND